jgi:hypothetical protein
MKTIKRLICLLLGHKECFNGDGAWCDRCGKSTYFDMNWGNSFIITIFTYESKEIKGTFE